MSARLIKVALLYLVVGVTMGIVMGITHQFVTSIGATGVAIGIILLAINIWRTVVPAVRATSPAISSGRAIA